MKKTIWAADLFCGAGGTSTGLAEACKEVGISRVHLIAINHWVMAVETHKANHPWATHICSSIDQVNPRKAVPGGRLDILVASPECVFHSVARGGRPVNDQQRASAWAILKWAQDLYIDNIAIENVPEFVHWGPLGADDRPLKSMRGKTYKAFIQALESLGYRVEAKILNAADFGDATTRRRLFILARRNHKKITWPEQTHTSHPGKDLFKNMAPWRPAREVIDWSIPGASIFARKKPLSPTTIERIATGLRKFGGPGVEPFLVMLFGTGKARSIHKPMPTVTAQGNHIALCEPFLVTPGGPDLPNGRSVNEPMPTVLCKDRMAVVEPFLIGLEHTGANGAQVRNLDEPVPTVTSHPRLAICQPFILAPLGIGRGNAPRPVDKPLPTVLASRGGGHLVQPFIVHYRGQSSAHSIDKPLPTQTTKSHFYLAQPFVIGIDHGKSKDNPRSVNEPLRTVITKENLGIVQPFIIGTGGPRGQSDIPMGVDKPFRTILTRNHKALVQPTLIPFLVKYYGTKQNPKSVDEPVETITAKDRFALVDPKTNEIQGIYTLDILFRMLQPHELAAAMSFPKDYMFKGNREDKVKQIGNAVCVRTAKALCLSLIAG